MNIKNKAQSPVWWIIIAAVIAIFVVIFVIMFFSRGGEKGFDALTDSLDQFEDCDSDEVPNIYDKCPYDKGLDNKDYEGCPSDVINEESLTKYNCKGETKTCEGKEVTC